jgi:predicted ATP-grasp superfamily ATP-dependent carboligase
MRTLILLGASVRAAAQSAVRAGFAPYAIDFYADRDCAACGPAIKVERYPHDFGETLAAAPAAPWIYTGGLENYPRLIDRLAKVRPLLGNGGHAVRRARDPMLLKAAAEQVGLPFPFTISGTNSPIPLGGARRWLIKPRRSSGGLGIRFIGPPQEERLSNPSWLQEYITGESVSAVFVAAGGRAALLGVTRQLLGCDFDLSRPFLYVGSVGPIVLRERELSRLHALANALAANGLVGLFNIDFVRNEAGLWPIEVNPRYSASVEVIERAVSLAAIDGHVRACTEPSLPQVVRPSSDRCVGKAVVYAQQSGTIPPRLDKLICEWNVRGEAPRLADLPRVGEPVKKDEPVLTVLAEGDSLADVESQLRRDVAAVHGLFSSAGD